MTPPLLVLVWGDFGNADGVREGEFGGGSSRWGFRWDALAVRAIETVMTVTGMFGVGAPPVVFHRGPFCVCCFGGKFTVTL